mmetsp:Transcript_493/g.484  ORF Transcript_493/g.484 Transcript_493/m.484 type:complete len:125 (+) Transcript_493:193-567(+)
MDDLLNKNKFDQLETLDTFDLRTRLSRVDIDKNYSSLKYIPTSTREDSICKDTEASSTLNNTVHNLSSNLQFPLKSCIKQDTNMDSTKSVKFLIQGQAGEDMIVEKSEVSEQNSEYDSFILYGI